ncbi:hypothetical protein ACIP98_03755 [Streptomyces sp. NPDC088354]|uniref:hypothetical protein n=1 Tax=Streptomyces sp. NPDC088354 TaxID=3365856 RepID=UPI00380DDB04
MGRYVDVLLPGVVRRALEGAEPQPPAGATTVLTVVSVDVDSSAGAGVVWIVWRPETRRARERTAVLEWHGERWQHVGGGIGPLDEPADVDVIEVRDGSGALSRTRRLDSLPIGPWISCVKVHVGPEVSHVLVGDRRIEAPAQRRLIVARTSPYSARPRRPLIVAFGHDGSELSRMAPTTAWTATSGNG